MNPWFEKFVRFRISDGLDEAGARPRWLEQAIARSEELQQFEQATAQLHRQLAESTTDMAAPGLHESVMTALRASRPVPGARLRLAIPRWLIAPTAAAVFFAAGWWFVRHGAQGHSTTNSLATGAAVLRIGGQIQPAIESAAVLPLSTELERFSTDLDQMTKFVLASLP
jgi:hypothetical protein